MLNIYTYDVIKVNGKSGNKRKIAIIYVALALLAKGHKTHNQWHNVTSSRNGVMQNYTLHSSMMYMKTDIQVATNFENVLTISITQKGHYR